MKNPYLIFGIIALVAVAYLILNNTTLTETNVVTEQQTSNIETGDQTIVGTVVGVSSEIDGNTVQLIAEDGTSYQTVVSIPNLGPESDFDFANLTEGVRLSIAGEVWEMENVPQLTARAVTVVENEQICVDNGGAWQPVGKLQMPMCIFTYDDAGQSCTSSADCQGNCIVTEVDGSNPQCAPDNNPFGCKSTVEDFAATGGIMCVD